MQNHTSNELETAKDLVLKLIENNLIQFKPEERVDPEAMGTKIAALFNTLVEKINY